MPQPLFTILIPTYNRGPLIGDTIRSVLSQPLAQQDDKVEIVIVDDGSTDDTRAVLAGFGDRVRVFTQPNRGPGAARNFGIAQARGEYVLFLDSDDLQFPWTLRNFRAAIDQYDRPSAVGSHEINFSTDAGLPDLPDRPPQTQVYPDLLAFYEGHAPVTFPAGAVIVRTDVLRAVGGFPATRNLNCEDIDLWLRIGTGPRFAYIASPPSYGLRQHEGNTSRFVLRSAEGLADIVAVEKAGGYPGGPQRRSARWALITFVGRAIIMQCVTVGQNRWAWRLYRTLFAWHLRLRRFKFLFGAPPALLRPTRNGGG